MTLHNELETSIAKIFKETWDTRDGRVVPAPENLKLGNDAVELKPATVLYADLDGSTNMVDQKTWQIAAEVYKAYLHCATKVIRSEGGAITSYDGDRVMGIFIGDNQSTSAVRSALKINYVVRKILNPSFKELYPKSHFEVKQVVGIDVSDIRAARTGVRGDNDIVWVGRAANYAAKLTSLGAEFPTWITEEVYDRLGERAKFGGNPKRSVWEKRLWTSMNKKVIYRSNWTWKID